MSLAHAKHNENLCIKLHTEDCYYDWIITTAFYSALHYSEFQLFPFNLGPTEYSTFDVYYNAFKRNNDNKHDARKRLIYSNIDSKAGAAYNWLKDLCWTARYYDYQITKEEADVALNKLNIIKTYITKTKS
ncbi:MAG: hypothetical protein EOP42_15830 [Sphingobacteriaceae bacterium]|nr:MAG: hypothetical protein EOP42_15830 [Sphingobacteriaceae bacterium]